MTQRVACAKLAHIFETANYGTTDPRRNIIEIISDIQHYCEATGLDYNRLEAAASDQKMKECAVNGSRARTHLPSQIQAIQENAGAVTR